jgi:pimeloyl-ACP methyl ester carboxylesterase
MHARRRSLAAALLLALLATTFAAAADRPAPILFVHGNGDSAAVWLVTIWRFESNGYDAGRLFAIDHARPNARSDDTQSQDNRSSSADQVKELAARVADIQARTGAARVVLVGSSRGGYSIRNYVKNGEGPARVSHVVLGGVPNHGVWATPRDLNSEFNGLGRFLMGLNAGDEVHPGIRFLTIRSDSNDKYAQPDGRFISRPGEPTNVTFVSPELRGATNIVIPGLDHRETAFHRLAFKEMYRFITGREPATLAIASEDRPVLNGLVSGFANRAFTNLPLAGATVEVYQIDPASGQRQGEPVHRRTIGADGLWGPLTASSAASYEFVVTAPGYPTTHIYRTPFPRSSAYVHLRVRPLDGRDTGPGSIVTLSRPRGYLGHGRDTFTIDGKVPDGVNPGVPGTSEAKMRFEPGPLRPVRVVLNSDTLTVLTHAVDDGHVAIAEFHR